MIETKYQHWLNFEGLDADLKKELEDQSEILEEKQIVNIDNLINEEEEAE